ncbi:MAG TPA: MarR family winged helix-turn-helix transcriptional regulator [Paracoccus sp. (in: a-proteobacteria)]|uniref:MarR family winged helix-turn-helix transcriptional regulator n=1 Tax=uncultured Paracoccus sp. TaxID=189685 RepID=UPI0026121C8A|nr:MarR family winged helix-turn-helix transcriptional regulator [uncultured Paracoccus sp.]HMQ42379.1 MarR family winged helix-turn-helix transcriptional regulator [Paracoccus sp. (in: a-proteobacteria)]HMR37481.1 MarR family winged helix-turn-helix transcriptional regulator [Paracoccus sp. (in: a-proteobacteria)]
MTARDGIAVLSDRIVLGYLSRDLTFMTRVLRAHVRWANTNGGDENSALGSDAAVLSVIGLNPGISQNDLASAVVLKKSAVTKLVSDMEVEGFVIRQKPETDRRYNALRLTAAGHAKWQLLQREMHARQEALLAPLDGRERDKLFELLGRLVIHYSDQLSADGQPQTDQPT